MNVFRYGSFLCWSTCRIHPGTVTNSRLLFVTGKSRLGQGFGSPSAHPDTNLVQGGSIPNGSDFDVTHVGWEVWGLADDRAVLFRYASWRWQLNQVNVDGAPLGVPPNVPFQREDGDVPDEYLQVPDMPVSRGILHLPVSMHIPGSASFAIDLNVHRDVLAPVDVRFTLYGSFSHFFELG